MTIEDADAACASREAFASLLDRLGHIAAPNTGAASILIALARLASNSCEWIDGDLAIELVDVDDTTEVGVMTELGAGMRERLFPPVRLRAPLSELTAALAAKPGLSGALSIHRRSWKRISLGANERIRVSSRPPRISDASLIAVRAPVLQQASPKRPVTEDSTVDAGWDDPDT
jgi:hypothetical protein